jgi:hypothetical protein
VNDDSRKVEQDTRDLVWVRLEIFPSHHTVKDDAGVWERDGLYGFCSYTSSVRSTCGSNLRPKNVLHTSSAAKYQKQDSTYVAGTISLAVFRVISYVSAASKYVCRQGCGAIHTIVEGASGRSRAG